MVTKERRKGKLFSLLEISEIHNKPQAHRWRHMVLNQRWKPMASRKSPCNEGKNLYVFAVALHAVNG